MRKERLELLKRINELCIDNDRKIVRSAKIGTILSYSESTRESTRMLVMLLKKEEFIENIKRGWYQITEAGQEIIGREGLYDI